jgi:hypothetical protein
MDPQSQANTPKTAEDYLGLVEKVTGKAAPKPLDVLQSEINELVKQVTVSEDGKFIYPDNTPEHLRLALSAEKKFRDTQSSYTRTNQELKDAREELEALRQQVASSNPARGLSDEDIERLDELKYTDPEEWYNERKRLESQAVQGLTQKEQEQRARRDALNAVNYGRANPITPDVLDNDIPPRINNKVLKGEITFEQYLAEVVAYLDKGRVVANPEAPGDTKLPVGGSASLTTMDAPQIDYSKITF